ncbi:MAG: sulfatase-like hydrolase/transferase [Pseudomonadota bacterium]|nr:sulfatase-like hydrolase/transferase [Pseudomonadota bacterium]
MTTTHLQPPNPIRTARIALKELARFLALLLPGFLALFLIVRAFVNGHVSDITFALWLLVIQGLSLLVPNPVTETRGDRKAILIKLAALLPAILLLFPLTVVVLIFGELDTAAFVFHLAFGIGGTPLGEFAPYIVTVTIYWAAILITLYRLRKWLRRIPFWWSLCCVSLIAGNPLIRDVLFNQFQAKYGRGESLITAFQDPMLIAPTEGENPDLIILYLEGMERTYGIKDSFGEIYAPIERLAESGVSFSDVAQIDGTGWSLAGMTATQCGMPLMPMGSLPLNRTADMKQIGAGVTCLTDILKARGYHSTYASTTEIIGSDRGHYGFDNFYRTHQLDQIVDKANAMTPGAIAARDAGDTSWALRDGEGYAIALAHVRERLKSDQPYALILSTMDTHGPKAHMSDQCVADGQPKVSDDLTDAVACTSKLTETFITNLRKLTKHRNTRIVVASDHLAHHNNLSPLLDKHPRRNMVMFLNGPDTPRVIDKPAAMPDIFPTLLHWLGWLDSAAPQAAGIGKSLFHDPATLIETFGIEGVNDRLRRDVELAARFWHSAP